MVVWRILVLHLSRLRSLQVIGHSQMLSHTKLHTHGLVILSPTQLGNIFGWMKVRDSRTTASFKPAPPTQIGRIYMYMMRMRWNTIKSRKRSHGVYWKKDYWSNVRSKTVGISSNWWMDRKAVKYNLVILTPFDLVWPLSLRISRGL